MKRDRSGAFELEVVWLAGEGVNERLWNTNPFANKIRRPQFLTPQRKAGMALAGPKPRPTK